MPYTLYWRTAHRTQDLALCSTIHLHQMHQETSRSINQSLGILGVHTLSKHNLTAELIGIHRTMMRKWSLGLQVLFPYSQLQPMEYNTNTLLKLHHSVYLGSLVYLWWDYQFNNYCVLKHLGRFTRQESNQNMTGFRVFITLKLHLNCSK